MVPGTSLQQTELMKKMTTKTKAKRNRAGTWLMVKFTGGAVAIYLIYTYVLYPVAMRFFPVD